MSTAQAVLDQAEPDDAKLMIDLQLQDIEAALGGLKLANDVNSHTTKIALELCQNDLRRYRSHVFNDTEEAQHAAAIAVATFDAAVQQVDCVSCFNNFPVNETLPAACNHYYCTRCVQELVQASMRDTTLYPPRCCRQPFDQTVLLTLLPPDLAQQFAEQSEELGDVRPTYCHSCGFYIGAANKTEHRGTCDNCPATTCLLCRRAIHQGDCEVDEGERAARDLARQEGWQQCNNCHRLVELTIGCNHITCHCRAEFCYVCGARWKTCDCPTWDEARLLARANQQLQREAVPRNARQVRERAREIEENHACQHNGPYDYVNGPHRCEECHFQLPRFILQCRRCRLRHCWRCRNNRM